MNVLVACEFSGTVRDAFIRHGHDAISCDTKPTESPGPHLQTDVLQVLRKREFDLVIAHPPCTYLANSGHHWNRRRPGRFAKVVLAAEFFRRFFDCAPMVAIESSQPGPYAKWLIGRNYSQKVRPSWFGENASKGVCLWLENLPPLIGSLFVERPEDQIIKQSPGPKRKINRSRFSWHVADAMAKQWGILKP